MTHQCAVPGCTEQIGEGFLMCLPHWKRVPFPLQREVNQTHARIRRLQGLAGATRRAAIREYRDACATAVACIEQKEVDHASLGV